MTLNTKPISQNRIFDIGFAVTEEEQYELLVSDHMPFLAHREATIGLCQIGLVERIVNAQSGYVEIGYQLTRLGVFAREQFLQERDTANHPIQPFDTLGVDK